MARSKVAILRTTPATVLAESRTCTLKLDVCPVVGVPAMVPVGASVKPSGNDPPARLHVFPPAPPLAVSVCE